MHVGDHVEADVGGALGAGLAAVLLDRAGRHEGFERAVRLTGMEELVGALWTRAGCQS